MKNDFSKVLLTEEQITQRVCELAAEIEADYPDRSRPLVCLCVLKGSVFFFAELLKHIRRPLFLDFISISSYGNSTQTSGNICMKHDVSEAIEGKDVLIVEDIVDTGLSLEFLVRHIQELMPSSLKVCCLLDKAERRKVDITAEYVGFSVPDEFLVGFGLDYAQKYRNLPYIAVLDPKIYCK